MRRWVQAAGVMGLTVFPLWQGGVLAVKKPRPQAQPNPLGAALTATRKKSIDPTNLYFAELGTNGRTCNSCHLEAAGWSVTPAQVQALFQATDGLDPLFRTNDGSVSPLADVSTLQARQAAYAPLLQRGVIRVGLPMPQGAEFTLEAVDDPHGFAGPAELSLFRRPLPAANLRFQSTVMWDGRHSLPDQSLTQNLADQASGATTGHAQAAAAPTAQQLAEIVDFESALFHAQAADELAGPLNARGGKGGPQGLLRQKFYLGMNDPFGPQTPRTRFNPVTFKLFARWAAPSQPGDAPDVARRKAIGRGEVVFNRKRFPVSGVRGLNDDLGSSTITVTCSSCHNAPNVGTNTLGMLQDLGISDAARRLPHQPLYTLRHSQSGQVIQTTDPGRALITGQWKDVNRFKVPSLRGLAARAPYFHDGSALTLAEVVEFYNTRFQMNLSPQDAADLEAFLAAL